MIAQRLPKLFGLLALLVIFLTATTSWALSPQSREKCGLIQSIDREHRALTLLPSKSDNALTFVWDKQTRFIHNWKIDSADSLKEGRRLCVYYRSPFFGKPYLTKIVWQDATQATPHPKNL